MSNVYVFGAAVDTLVAGVYRYDVWMTEAGSLEEAEAKFELEEPWSEVSTSVEEYIGIASAVAHWDRTIAEEIDNRHHE